MQGHSYEDSNIVQFNKDKAVGDARLWLLLHENKFFSHDTLAQQEGLKVLSARRDLLRDVNGCDF